ncbi:MAG: nuclear transport factor 2 family protein [Acidithiobacillales bacterium]
MRFRTFLSAMALTGGLVVAPLAAAQQPKMSAADEVIAVTKAQWAAENAKNVAEAMKSIADDYTEFNGEFSTRLDGKALATRLSEAGTKDAGVPLVSEMANPKVQVYGDVAILTYNYVGLSQGKDGKVEPTRAKSTRVYVKQGGHWMLVHANFGADPMPK